MTMYDAVVIGSGPAGYTAGIYLARFLMKTLLLDTLVLDPEQYQRSAGRSSVPGVFHNIPGFPEGIERHKLKWLGIHQAQNAGCDYQIDRAVAITHSDDSFVVHGDTRQYHGKAVFLAMGIEDDWGDIPDMERIAGRSLYWSVPLNGKEIAGAPAAIIGHDEQSVEEVFQLRWFTDQAYLLTHGRPLSCSDPAEKRLFLSRLNIPVIEQPIQHIESVTGEMERVMFADGSDIRVKGIFSPSMIHHPRSYLARNLGVHLDERGFVQVNQWGETNIPHVYAIGDITATPAKVVLHAYHQAMTAAYALYRSQCKRVVRAAVQSDTSSL